MTLRGAPDLSGRRVVLVAVGTRGDVEPFARLGQVLGECGAIVSAGVLEDGAERMRRAGVRPLVLGPPSAESMWWTSATARAAAEVSQGLMYAQLRGRLAALAARAASVLAPAVQDADVMLTGMHGARALPTLHRLGLPARLVLLAPLGPHPRGTSVWNGPVWGRLPRPLESARQQLMWRMTTGMAEALSQQLARRCAVPEGRTRPACRRSVEAAYPPLLATSRALDPTPPPDVLQTGWWVDPSPATPLPAEIDRWLTDHPGAVLLTSGSMLVFTRGDQVARLADVGRRVGRPVVVQGVGVRPGPRGQVLVVGEADYRALLPRVEVVVHHGGAGTTHAAAAAGTPQVVLPLLRDQLHYGRQVHGSGLGPAPLMSVRASRRSLAARLARALDAPTHRRAATRTAAMMTDEDGLSAAVTEVARMCR